MEGEKGFVPVSQSEGKKKGQKICAWCNKDLGEWEGEGISHGMCEECHGKEMAKINSFKSRINKDEKTVSDEFNEKKETSL